MSTTTDVLVIGGGIIGAAIAERLTRAGRRVVLIERGRLGGEASHAAAGLLTPVHPWDHTEDMLRLEAESLTLWPGLAERLRTDTGVDIELRQTGLLALIETDEDEREAARRMEWKRARGEAVEQLDAAGARELEPALADSVRGALRFPDLRQIRNHRVAPALGVAAAARGADVREHVSALSLLTAGGRVTGARTSSGDVVADAVIVAAGAWTGGLLGDAGPVAARTTPARGQIVMLRAHPGAVRHMLLGSDGAYVVPRADGRILVGSTVEYVGFDHAVTAEGLRHITTALARLAPGLTGARLEATWAGLRPDTPDHLPVLGWARPGLLLATGHFRSGIILAPVTAEIVAEIVAGECDRDLTEMAPGRDVVAAA